MLKKKLSETCLMDNFCLVWNETEFFLTFVYWRFAFVLAKSWVLKLMFNFFHFICFVCVHMCTCGGQKIIYRGQFCPSTKWIQGLNSGSSFNPVCHLAWTPPQFFVIFNLPFCRHLGSLIIHPHNYIAP